MIRPTQQERMQKLQNRITHLENLQKRNESIKTIKAQGTDGASTEFIDPLKIDQMIEKLKTKLEEEWKTA